MTSWNGRAVHADTLGLGELALNPPPLSRNPSLSPSSNPNPNSNPSPPKVHDDVRVPYDVTDDVMDVS